MIYARKMASVAQIQYFYSILIIVNSQRQFYNALTIFRAIYRLRVASFCS